MVSWLGDGLYSPAALHHLGESSLQDVGTPHELAHYLPAILETVVIG